MTDAKAPRIEKKPKNVQEDARKKLQQTVRRLANTRDGLDFLRYLMDKCGYQKPSLVVNAATGEINPVSTCYNESIRGIYLDIRKYIPPEKLILIEIGVITDAEEQP